jgi:hypothetical protein
MQAYFLDAQINTVNTSISLDGRYNFSGRYKMVNYCIQTDYTHDIDDVFRFLDTLPLDYLRHMDGYVIDKDNYYGV